MHVAKFLSRIEYTAVLRFGDMIGKSQRWTRVCLAAAMSLGMASAGAVAQTISEPENSWYVLGGGLDAEATGDPMRLGFTYSNTDNPDRFQIMPNAGALTGLDGHNTIFVDGSYDWDVDLPIVPHVTAGLGLTYLDRGGASIAGRSEDDTGVSTVFRVGLGASYRLGESWSLTAEYAAAYLGADRDVSLVDLDRGITQNFTIGAKIRF